MAVCSSTIERNTPRRMGGRVILEMKFSTALNKGAEVGEIGIDGCLQLDDRAEHAAADALPGHLGEEVFARVEPGGRSRGEVETPARMARQPGQHLGMFVSGIVVKHGVDQLA